MGCCQKLICYKAITTLQIVAVPNSVITTYIKPVLIPFRASGVGSLRQSSWFRVITVKILRIGTQEKFAVIIVFGADPVGVGVSMTLSCSHDIS